MAKRLLVLGFVLILAASAECSTIILKNGKTMTGTVVSETDSIDVFQDDHGLQLSVKKSLIDVDKTKQANEPPAPPVVAVAAQTPAPEKKDVKVYGQNDVEPLRDKYGDLSPGRLTIEGDPGAYYETLQT